MMRPPLRVRLALPVIDTLPLNWLVPVPVWVPPVRVAVPVIVKPAPVGVPLVIDS